MTAVAVSGCGGVTATTRTVTCSPACVTANTDRSAEGEAVTGKLGDATKGAVDAGAALPPVDGAMPAAVDEATALAPGNPGFAGVAGMGAGVPKLGADPADGADVPGA